MVQGDWNAKVGEDAYQYWEGTCGKYCNTTSSDRGLRLLEFASYNSLILANTLGPHKVSRRVTWHSPNGEHHNQIDYIMVNRRFRSSINIAKTQSFPGADIGSDHELVIMTFKLHLKRVKKQGQTRIKKAMKKAKENWIDEQCQSIEDNLKKNNSKKAYQLVKDLTSTKKVRTSTIQNKDGKSLTEDQEILKRWTEYCSELYNYTATGDSEVLQAPTATSNDNYPILREEVEVAVKSLKKGKSAGVDNIPGELVQAGGEAMISALLTICNKVWQTGEWPTTWTQSLIITLPKKGNLQLCQNYQTFSLVSHPSKVMLKILLNRLKPQAEWIIAEEQAGFRAGRSTTEQIFNLRIICERYLQH